MKETKLKPVILWFALIVCILSGVSMIAFGDDQGSSNQAVRIFSNPWSVHEVSITIDPDDWEGMRRQVRALRRVPRPATVVFDGIRLEEVGVATAFLRQGDPNFYLYPNLRIRFGAFRSDQRLLGLQGIDLKGFGSEDNSLIVEKLAWELFDAFDMPCSRTAYARLTVNDEYIGAYVMIESISDVIARSFEDDRGNLYKLKNTTRSPNGVDAFAPASQNPDDPGSYIGDQRSQHMPFEKPVGNPDGYDLVALIQAFNQTTPALVRQEVSRRLDLDSLIDLLAVDMSLSDTDSLIAYDPFGSKPVYYQNNVFFYHDPTSDKFFLLPDDLDGAFDAFDPESVDRDLTDGWNLMRITKLLLDNQDLMDRYFARAQYFVARFYYPPGLLLQEIDGLANSIRPAVIDDLRRTTDDPPRLMTVADWEKRVDDLRQYVRDRATNLQQQLYGP